MKYDEFKLNMETDNSHSLILRRINPNSTVLEFGPATGNMTRYLKEELGCKVYGVEIDPISAKIASKYTEELIVCDIENYVWFQSFQDIQFDYIIFADVLEHLKDPWKVLAKAGSLLKTNASVLTSIPNVTHSAIIMDLMQGRFQYRSVGLLDDTHLRFFSKEGVLRLLESAGLAPIKWFGTYALPDQTEFQQNYNLFPPDVQNYLKNRDDSHVYQFVTESKRIEDVSSEEVCHFHEYSHPFQKVQYIQIFWDHGEGFSENASIRFPIQTEEVQKHVTFSLPVSRPIKQIRIDPTNFISFIRVKEITITEIINQQENVLKSWCFDSDNSSSIDIINMLDFQNAAGEVCHYCINHDPHFIVPNLPDMNPLFQYYLNIHISLNANISFEIDKIINEFRNKEQGIVEEKQQVLIELGNKRSELDKINSKLLEQIVYTNHLVGEISQLRLYNESILNDFKQLEDTLGIIKQYNEDLEQLFTLMSTHYSTVNKSNLIWRIIRLQAKYYFKLIPINGILNIIEGIWRTQGNDPHFILEGNIPTGLMNISFQAVSATPIDVKLYLDKGKGFNETDSLLLTTITNENCSYSIPIMIDKTVKAIRIDPGEGGNLFFLANIRMDRINKYLFRLKSNFTYITKKIKRIKTIMSLIKPSYIKRALSEISHNGISGLIKKIKSYYLRNLVQVANYKPQAMDLASIKNHITKWEMKPLISIIMPVFNTDTKWLSMAVSSVEEQLYTNWELCIANDNSTSEETIQYLNSLNNPRIKVIHLDHNCGISIASNEAAKFAGGQYIAFLDHDDILTKDALYEVVKVILEKEPNVIYSDEDKIDNEGRRHTPSFKPDWSPDLLKSYNYINHFLVVRLDLFKKIGCFQSEYDGSQDYDLLLRLSEMKPVIYHIPKVLYSWRETSNSTSKNPYIKPECYDLGYKALAEHLNRMFGSGYATPVKLLSQLTYDVRYHLQPDVKVSIIIPTKDKIELLSPCIESIMEKTSYTNFEILIMNNNSELVETFNYFNSICESYQGKVRVVDASYPFNWSKLNNHGIREAKGDVFVFLNNDTIIITEDWLTRLAEKAMRDDVGSVGALLLYEDGTIQHAGVIIGMGGWADHVYKAMKPLHSVSPFVSPLVVRNVAASTGACLAISKKTIDKIGMFDEEFIICGSDVEISLRAVKYGLVNLYDPFVRLYHLESKTRSSYVPEIDFILSAKHYSPYREEGDPYYNLNLDINSFIPIVK